MKKTWLFAAALAIGIISCLVLSVNRLHATAKMPAFALPEVTQGRPIDSKDLQGKVLLVVFFATWCPPCMEEVPGLVELQAELSRDGFSVVAFSVDSEGPRVVSSLIKRVGINYPVMMADEKTVIGFGGIRGIPTSFLVNQKGDIVKKYDMSVPYSVFAKDIKSLMN